MSRKSHGAPLATQIRKKLEKLVKSQGKVAVAQHAGLSVSAIMQALAGLNVHAGTAALIERAVQS